MTAGGLVDRQSRRRAVLDVTAANGFAHLVVASTGWHMIDVPNPLAHLTGFRSTGTALAVLSVDGRLSAFVTPEDDLERAKEHFGAEVDACDAPLTSVGRWAGRFNNACTVGLDLLPHRLAAEVRSALGDPAAFDDTFYSVTSPKVTEEAIALQRATEIAELAYEKLKSWARPGMRECDLAVRLNLFMKELGADDCFLMLSASPHSSAIMPSTERVLNAGDLILVELSPSVDGQFVQICRTASLGRPSEETRLAYDLLVTAMHEGISRIYPGVRMGDVCQAIDDSLSAAGYAQYSRPPFIKRRGHGLGAGSIHPGDVAVNNNTPLAAGMVFIVHPNQFLPSSGYMMCGEPVMVGPAGATILSRRGARLDVIEC